MVCQTLLVHAYVSRKGFSCKSGSPFIMEEEAVSGTERRMHAKKPCF